MVGLGGNITDRLEVDVSTDTQSSENTENDEQLVVAASARLRRRSLVGKSSSLTSESGLLGESSGSGYGDSVLR